MKKTDLEKNKALKIVEKMKKTGTPGRFGAASGGEAIDRREQRKLDQAQGLVSFPVKLKQDTIAQLRKIAEESNTSTNEVLGALLDEAIKSRS